MANVEARYIYVISSIWFSPDIFGQNISFSRDAHEVRIDIPTPEFTRELIGIHRRIGYYNPTIRTWDDNSNLQNLNLFTVLRVCVLGEAYPGANAQFLMDNLGIANSVLTQFVDWVRIRNGQAWIGVHGDPPELLTGQLVEQGTQAILQSNISSSTPDFAVLHGHPRAIGLDDCEFIKAKLGVSAELPQSELLLADALFHIGNAFPDTRRAVLLAAIACETKIKSVLRRLAGNKQKLVDLLIENPRDYSLAAEALFTKALDAIADTSLRNAQPNLHKSITKLFQIRNKIAHRGYIPSIDEASPVVNAANEAFTWLDTVMSETNVRGEPEPDHMPQGQRS